MTFIGPRICEVVVVALPSYTNSRSRLLVRGPRDDCHEGYCVGPLCAAERATNDFDSRPMSDMLGALSTSISGDLVWKTRLDWRLAG
jgi:hypothetical protein